MENMRRRTQPEAMTLGSRAIENVIHAQRALAARRAGNGIISRIGLMPRMERGDGINRYSMVRDAMTAES